MAYQCNEILKWRERFQDIFLGLKIDNWETVYTGWFYLCKNWEDPYLTMYPLFVDVDVSVFIENSWKECWHWSKELPMEMEMVGGK